MLFTIPPCPLAALHLDSETAFSLVLLASASNRAISSFVKFFSRNQQFTSFHNTVFQSILPSSLNMKLVSLLALTARYIGVTGRSIDTLTEEDYPVDATELPTACNDLENGYHWIRPMAHGDTFPNIYVKCVDGYTMLDPSLMDFYNHHHIKALFSTYNELTRFCDFAIFSVSTLCTIYILRSP